MGKIEVAFCEEDETYRNRFVTYLMEYRSKEIAVSAFSTVKSFVEEAKKRKFDVILLGRGFAKVAEILWEQKFPVLLLEDQDLIKVAEDETCNRDSDMRTVFRYQSMEYILHEILAVAQGNENDPAPFVRISEMEMIGVCAPGQCEMQIPFSVVGAQYMAEKKKVLYLNLTEHSGFMNLFELDCRYDMADLVVRLRRGTLTQEILFRCIYELDHIFYIPPFGNPENLHEFLFSDFLALLRYLGEKTDFQLLVVDFGGGLDQFSKMLEQCSNIYCLTRQGYFYECQIKQFSEYIEKCTCKNMKDRLHYIDIPFSAKNIRCSKDVLRQLLYSEFGDYVRSCFQGQLNREKR